MKALLGAELRRVLARRLVRVVGALAMLGVAIAGVATFLSTDSATTAKLRAQRASAAIAVEECIESDGESGFAERGPGDQFPTPPPGVPPGVIDDFCRHTAGQVHDPRFRVTNLKGIFQGLTAAAVVAGWLIGASVIGADWQSRTITTVLTWEPRRVRVLLSKVAACGIVSVALALVVDALLTGALLPTIVWHGTTVGVDGEWVRSVAGVLSRGSLLVAVATIFGFSVASVGRNAAAALGIGFAYFAVIENVVGGLVEETRPWLLLGNAIVLVSGRNDGGDVIGRSVIGAGFYLVVVAAACLAVATVVFRRRDVA